MSNEPSLRRLAIVRPAAPSFGPLRDAGLRAAFGIWLALSFVGGPASIGTGKARAESPPPVDFSRDVRPLLAQNCFACHGFDAAARQAGLRLDRADAAVAKLPSGATAVAPGRPDQSELIARIVHVAPDLRMPPASTGHALTAEQAELLRRWIASGARFDDHWSFRPIARPSPPSRLFPASPQSPGGDEAVRHPIDAFVMERLERESLAPSPAADRATLLRRLSLDLLGLPPRPEEVEAFLADDAPDAVDRLVDRLLASPRFGERWGRHWLDLARYADSDGYLGDGFRTYAWLYRDWVVDALNRDMPFDQFTIEQLAGDLLPEASVSQRMATGFLRNTMRNTEAGVDLEEYRLKEIVDRVSTVGIGWLGLSLGCAECHSHKYDPISHREFYQLFSFFNDADDVDVPAPRPGEQQRYESKLRIWNEADAQLAPAFDAVWAPRGELLRTALAVEPKKRTAPQKQLLETAASSTDDAARRSYEEYGAHLAKKPAPPAIKAMTVARRKQPRPAYVHLRGDYRSRGETVEPGTPACLPPLAPRQPAAASQSAAQGAARPDRLDLARWLVDPAHPLTARVTANRFWSHLFGRGLVASVDNFGTGGEAPSHPELLDWLSRELIASGWSSKATIRAIVGSATYRQASHVRRDLESRDPTNVLLARQSRLRLEAEAVRDAALAASGLLDNRFGGPGIRPPQPDYVASISRNADWKTSEPPDLYRRGLYIVFRRATPYPMLLAFDAPDSTVTCVRRERSNSPLQSLTLLNDPVFFTCAQNLGRELAAERPTSGEAASGVSKNGMSVESRLSEAYRRCLGREPSRRETERLRDFFHERRSAFAADRRAARAVVGANADDNAIAEQAAWIATARVLMNLDEFITRE